VSEPASPRGPVIARSLFFAVLLAYLASVGQWGLPTVHAFYDGVAMRDSCTVWDSLTWNVRDGRHFLPAAFLGAHEGPLQVLVLNLYCHAVGDLLPLNPRTMQIPNTILAFSIAWMAFVLGRSMHSERFGYLCALSFVVVPWLVGTIRSPWVFNLLSVLCEFTVIWLYVRFSGEPERPWLRIAAPASLALYLLTGLDWPSFISALVLLLLLSRRLRPALHNWWNALPGAVIVVFAVWTIALFVYGRYYAPHHAHLYKWALLVIPFFKVLGADSVPLPGPARIIEYAWDTFGPALPVALAGVVAAMMSRGRPAQAAITSPAAMEALLPKILTAMAVWLLALIPLLRTSNAPSYGYVVAVPMAIMSACLLVSVRAPVAALLVAATLVCQLRLVPVYMTVPDSARNRVLAAATFLIEQRPDLLRAGKVALLPTDEASNVGQYARGPYTRIVMPFDYPAVLNVHGVASKAEVLKDFVEAYERRGEVKADWVILTSSLLDDEGSARGFFQRLRDDPRIRWIATFKESHGRDRALWVGEVAGAGAGREPAREYDVEALARRYEEKYDRISFLKRDVRHVMHE
jgi:hypothetical protein